MYLSTPHTRITSNFKLAEMGNRIPLKKKTNYLPDNHVSIALLLRIAGLLSTHLVLFSRNMLYRKLHVNTFFHLKIYIYLVYEKIEFLL